MRGLTIVVTEAVPSRFRSALTMALACAALGGRARLFLDGEAAGIVRATDPHDHAHAAAGLPTLPDLIAEALDAGVALILCQSGMALTGTDATCLDPRIETGGMVSLLRTLGEDRLVIA